ncbi:unnamed protein product, partial [Iphiclides podalirius]
MDNEDIIFDIHKLSLNSDFDSQVQEILKFIRLSKSEVEHLQLLFNDLQNTLQTAWPGCEVQAFGSIVTGLGIKSSNVDCYISLPTWLPNRGAAIRCRDLEHFPSGVLGKGSVFVLITEHDSRKGKLENRFPTYL